ncbi:MAG: hypothetical protein J6A55_04890 [Oscillospiraceae bacterium]|nr:hypothetical protein [Oscillospiraceae bacterium]
MGLFKRKTDATPYDELLKLHGKKLSSVVERKGGEEIVLGKEGAISVVGKELVIVCNAKEVFRCDTKNCVAATLMSGNGCDIKGFSDGVKRHIVANYSRLK